MRKREGEREREMERERESEREREKERGRRECVRQYKANRKHGSREKENESDM